MPDVSVRILIIRAVSTELSLCLRLNIEPDFTNSILRPRFINKLVRHRDREQQAIPHGVLPRNFKTISGIPCSPQLFGRSFKHCIVISRFYFYRIKFSKDD